MASIRKCHVVACVAFMALLVAAWMAVNFQSQHVRLSFFQHRFPATQVSKTQTKQPAQRIQYINEYVLKVTDDGRPRVAVLLSSPAEVRLLQPIVVALLTAQNHEYFSENELYAPPNVVTIAINVPNDDLDMALKAVAWPADVMIDLQHLAAYAPHDTLTASGDDSSSKNAAFGSINRDELVAAAVMEQLGEALRAVRPSHLLLKPGTLVTDIASLTSTLQNVANICIGVEDQYLDMGRARGRVGMMTRVACASRMVTSLPQAFQRQENTAYNTRITTRRNIFIVGSLMYDALKRVLTDPLVSRSVQSELSQAIQLAPAADIFSEFTKVYSASDNTILRLCIVLPVASQPVIKIGDLVDTAFALGAQWPSLKVLFVVNSERHASALPALQRTSNASNVAIVTTSAFDTISHVLAASDILLMQDAEWLEAVACLGRRVVVTANANIDILTEYANLTTVIPPNTPSPQIVETVAGVLRDIQQQALTTSPPHLKPGYCRQREATPRVAFNIQRHILRPRTSSEKEATTSASLPKLDAGFGPTCSAQSALHTVTPRKLAELLELPSRFKPGSAEYQLEAYDTTVVIAVYRRPQYLDRMLWALGNQTHKVKEVWVTAFSSAQEEEFRQIVKAHDPTHAVYKFISGDVNFKYYGRFALAMMARTPYVMLFDDDCIPGTNLLYNALHTINIEGDEYNGLIGMKGHGNTVEDVYTHQQDWYFKHWEYRPDRIVPVDLTGGMWFARTEWIRMMWRDQPISIMDGPWDTGEDFQISHNLRKFMNLNTFLLATNPSDKSTWAHSPDYFAISKAGDSTKSNALYNRADILFKNMMRGYVPARAADLWGERHSQSNVVVVISTVEEAAALVPVYQYISAFMNETVRMLPIIAVDPRTPGASLMRDRMLQQFGITFNPRKRIVGVWDLDLAQNIGRMRWRDIDVVMNAQASLAGIFDTIRPAVVVAAFNTTSAMALATATAAKAMKIPTIGYEHPAACVVQQLDIATRDRVYIQTPPPIRWCLPAHPFSSSVGNFPVVVNSQLLLMQNIIDTLCSCRQSSSHIGAYAECPGHLINDVAGYIA